MLGPEVTAFACALGSSLGPALLASSAAAALAFLFQLGLGLVVAGRAFSAWERRARAAPWGTGGEAASPLWADLAKLTLEQIAVRPTVASTTGL